VYATIASHWYCPPQVPEHRYKAEIQGHLEIVNGVKRPKYNSRNNYDDYAIGDGNANRDGRLGIKLDRVNNLRVLKEFKKSTQVKNCVIRAYQEILPLLTPETTLAELEEMMMQAGQITAATLRQWRYVWHPDYNHEQINLNSESLLDGTELTNFTSTPQMSNPEPVTPATLTPLQAANRDRSNAAKSRIERAYQAVQHQLKPETTIAQRRRMICLEAKSHDGIAISPATFDKCKEVWHPEHNGEQLDPTNEPLATLYEIDEDTLDLDEAREILSDLHANGENFTNSIDPLVAANSQAGQDEAEISPKTADHPLRFDRVTIVDSPPTRPFPQPDPNITWFIAEIQTLRDRIHTLESDNEALKAAMTQPHGLQPANDLASDLVTLQHDWATAANERDRLTAENETLKANWANAANEVERLTALNQSLESHLAMFRSVLDGVEQITILSPPAAGTPIPPAAGTAFHFYDEFASTPLADVEAAIANLPPSPIDKPHRIPIPSPAKKSTSTHWSPETESSVNRAIDAVIAWNEHHQNDRLRASIDLLGDLCRPMGANHRIAISLILKSRASELQAHYQLFKIGERDNRFVNLSEILPLVARDYLKLENWQDVVSSQKHKSTTRR
jgi:hypothetical protein